MFGQPQHNFRFFLRRGGGSAEASNGGGAEEIASGLKRHGRGKWRYS